VLLAGTDKLVIRLALLPPGVDPGVSVEHAVPIEAEAELPPSEVDAWLRQHEGTLYCQICGREIAVKRHHFWNGLPEYHPQCWHAEIVRRRANPAKDLTNGQQAAKVLGIGRTTLGRWLTSGKPKPIRKQSGVWLFRKATILRLAARRLDKAGYVNAEQTALTLGIMVGTLTRWRKAGKITQVRKQGGVWFYAKSEIKRVAAKLLTPSGGSRGHKTAQKKRGAGRAPRKR
jgi:hypothetical protein